MPQAGLHVAQAGRTLFRPAPAKLWQSSKNGRLVGQCSPNLSRHCIHEVGCVVKLCDTQLLLCRGTVRIRQEHFLFDPDCYPPCVCCVCPPSWHFCIGRSISSCRAAFARACLSSASVWAPVRLTDRNPVCLSRPGARLPGYVLLGETNLGRG